MKKTKRSIYEPLDDFEKQLIKDLENDKFVEIPNQKKKMEKYRSYANYTLEKIKKEKRITIRVKKDDLESIQNKAMETGIPYQTLIAAILRKFAQGKISIGV